MKLRRLSAIAYKETLQVWRDPRSLAVALLMPAMQMVLLGYGVSLDIRHVPLCVYDQEQSQISRALVADFTDGGWFDVVSRLPDEPALRAAMDRGTCAGALTIPVDFTRVLTSTGAANVQIVFDGTDANTTNIATGYAQAIIAQASADFQSRWGQAHALPAPTRGVVDLEPRVWFNEGLDSRNFIVPGVVAVILALVGSQLTSLTVAREWERGTMEQLISTPVTALEMMFGKLAPYFLIGMLDAAFCLAATVFWFHVPFRGNLLALTVTTGLFALVVLGIGYLLSVRIHNQVGASQVALLVTLLPTTMLSGYTFPLDQMPLAVQAISLIVFARYYVTILRAVFLKGSPLAWLAAPVFALVVTACIIIWLAARAFRKRLD
ncbi:MAG TPA: ABC transporter permease [Acidocella sp.]|jgi:ABC-2 type transport system permease protein|uniref:ABC transporter permease n=1 Tax=Acidocella sp. TaxID=50710 RepID=UPI002C13B5FF|nr:ABC transporter permease [Acidocella sp.]HVE21533.1 ABC transporter permease [Acidocella sp.]